MKPIKEPTEENPYIVESYPYGFKRTSARFWIETKKGQRVIFQTLNPNTKKWNNIKKGVYSDIRVLYINSSNNHVESTGLDFGYDDNNKLQRFLSIFGSVLTDFQLKRLLVFKAIIKTRKSVKMVITDNPNEKEQEQAKKNLRNIFIKNLKELGG